MNIWFLTFEFPPSFGGGLSTYMHHITQMYSQTNDRVRIFALDPSISSRVQEDKLFDNIEVVRFRGNEEDYYRSFGYWTAVANEFAQHVAYYASKFGAPEIIEAADGFGIGYICLKKKLCLDPLFVNTKFVTTVHTPTYFIDRLDGKNIYELPRYWHRHMELTCISQSDGLIWISKQMRDRLRHEVEASVCENEIIFNPFQGEYRPVKEGQRSGFFIASRFSQWKGVIRAVEVFDKLWEEGLAEPLRIYGDDSDLADTPGSVRDDISRRFGRRLEQGLLTLSEKLPRSRIDELECLAVAQLHPAKFDNFPYSVIEGIAAGQLQVLSSTVGICELLPANARITVDVEDADSWRTAINAALKMSYEERASLSKRQQGIVDSDLNYKSAHYKRTTFFRKLLQAENRKIYPFLTQSKIPDIRHDSKLTRGRLSVVIPFFNMGDFITETLASIKNSDYPDIEIIVVDDGSTNTKHIEILKRESSRFGARVITQENAGVAAARNRGAREATGEFLALLDADDLVAPDYYKKSINVLNQYSNVSFVGSWSEDFNENGKLRHWFTTDTELPIQIIFNLTNCQALVYRSTSFMDYGLHKPELKMFLDDWESTVSVMANGHFGVMLPQALFKYRVREGSIFRSKKGLWNTNFLKMIDSSQHLYGSYQLEIIKFLQSNGPNYFYHIPGFQSGLNVTDQLPNRRLYHYASLLAKFMDRSRLGQMVRRIGIRFESKILKLGRALSR